jgi:hypothetical protein
MTKPYCGSNETPPKGTHLATEEECIKKRQVRRYGVKEVDPVKLALSKVDAKKERIKLFGIKGKIQKIEENIKDNLVQINRDKVSKEDKDKFKGLNKQLDKELKELKIKEKEKIQLLKGVKSENKEKKDSDDLEMTEDNIKLLLVRYRTRVLRLNKELEQNPDDKDLIKQKQNALEKYIKYKELSKK